MHVVKWSVGCLRSGGRPLQPSTGPGPLPYFSQGLPHPKTSHVPLPITWISPALFPFHWVPAGLRLESHPTRLNTILLTLFLKSSKAFQTARMDGFIMQHNSGSGSDIYSCLMEFGCWKYGGHLLNRSMCLRDKTTCSASLT